MKKTFSALLIATFVAYAAFARQSSQSTVVEPIAIVSPLPDAAATKPVPVPATTTVPATSSKPKSATTVQPSLPTPSVGSSTPTATTPTPAPAPIPVPVPAPAPAPVTAPKPVGQYKDGTYTGTSVNAYYGYVQVAAVISGGKLTNVQMLDYPRDQRTSQQINSYALPILISEAIKAQSATIDAVSGASETSPSFKSSLASALALAKN